MNYLIYGDLINSRQQSVLKIKYFWGLFPKLNAKLNFVVPFFPFMGDAFIGITSSKDEALIWVEELKKKLFKHGLTARYVLIPVRGDFSSLNTETKLFKKFNTSCVNPLNIPELLIAHSKMEQIKDSKKEEILILKSPSLKRRAKFHTLMTKEYFKES